MLHACGKRSQSALLLISSRTTRLSSQQGAENESGKTTITIRSFTAEAAAAAAAREQQLCCAVYCISFHVSCCHSNIDARLPVCPPARPHRLTPHQRITHSRLRYATNYESMSSSTCATATATITAACTISEKETSLLQTRRCKRNLSCCTRVVVRVTYA